MTFSPINSQSSFLPVEFDLPKDQNMFYDFISKRERLTASLLNVKEIGVYELNENLNGKQFFSKEAQGKPRKTRYGYRTVYNRGALAAGATDTFLHNITGLISFTATYGEAITAVPDFRQIPYVSVTAVNQQIEIKKNATQVIVINGAAAPAITSYIIVLDYLKQ